MKTGMVMSLRQEIHDAECNRCGEPRPSDRECVPCAHEDARIGAAHTLAAARTIDAVERDRNERRKENLG